ncbi:unnamed protein product [Prorocentrum cordatum]|uniref:Uncharacterized protein n=1 Tax=Prorocentrum cordatum TaxID=2364126 RepID=A0ABN9SB31_9DINO|nr:unnamed protein product [Polarella glacialis]
MTIQSAKHMRRTFEQESLALHKLLRIPPNSLRIEELLGLGPPREVLASRALEMRGTGKKQKLDPVSQHCVHVSEGLEQAAAAEVIPEVVSEMLATMLQGSLAVPKDARHAHQEGVVEMVCEALVATEVALKQAVTEAQGVVDGGTGRKVACEEDAKTKKEALAALEEDGKAKKVALAAAAASFKQAKGAVGEAQTAQMLAEADLKEARAKKGVLEGALKDMVSPLAEGTLPEGEVAGTVSRLKAALKKFVLVESLMTALPNALSKPPSTRGAFDVMVVSQLNEEMGKLISSLDATISQGDSTNKERSAALAVAEAALDESKRGQLAAAQAFRDARDALDKARGELKEAERRLKELGPESKRSQGALDEAQAILELFQAGALASAQELKARLTPPPEPEPASEAPLAEAEVGAPMEEAAPAEEEASPPAGAAEPAAAPAA